MGTERREFKWEATTNARDQLYVRAASLSLATALDFLANVDEPLPFETSLVREAKVRLENYLKENT